MARLKGGPSALSLEVVSINDNKLTTMNVDFAKMPNLKALHLRNNDIQRIDIRSLLNVPGLRICDLDENPFLAQSGAKIVYKQVQASITRSLSKASCRIASNTMSKFLSAHSKWSLAPWQTNRHCRRVRGDASKGGDTKTRRHEGKTEGDEI
eukprot:scaffold109_cov252-Pinguiococcus_pyrenoidosus.AAC.89